MCFFLTAILLNIYFQFDLFCNFAMISKFIVKCELDVMPSTIQPDDCSYINTQHIHTLRPIHILTDILVHTTSIVLAMHTNVSV